MVLWLSGSPSLYRKIGCSVGDTKGGNQTFAADVNRRENHELNLTFVHLIFVVNQSQDTADQS